MANAPDPAVLNVIVEAVGDDVAPAVGVQPRSILDDTAIHVGDVEAAVWALGGIDEAAVDVRAAEKLFSTA